MKQLITISSLLIFTACSSSATVKSVQKTAKKSAEEIEYQNKSIRYFTNGTILMNAGEYSKALNEFYQALLYDPKSIEIYKSLATCLIRLKRLDAAEINLEKARALEPKNIGVLDMLASVQTQLKKSEKALANYQEIHRIDRTNRKSFEMICFFYSIKNDDKKLISFIQENVKYIDVPPELAYSLASYFYKVKDFKKAQQWVSESLRKDPNFESAKLLQSQLDLISGKTDTALESFKKLYKKNPDNYRILYRIVEILRNNKNYQEVISILKGKEGIGDQFLLFLGEAYYKLGNYQEAQDSYADLALNNYNIYFEFIAADIELKLNNFETAHAYFINMIKREPSMAQGYYGAAFSLIRQEQYADAETILREGLVKSKDHTPLYPLLSETLIQLNKLNEANNYIENLVKSDPTNAANLASAASFYERAKNYRKSDELYDKAVALDSENALLLNNYSYSLSKRSIQLEKALKLIKKALVKEPNNSFYLDTIGWVYYKMKNYKLALDFVKKSIEKRGKGKESAEVYDHLGDIYKALGEEKNALIYWQKAIDNDASIDGVQDKINSYTEN